MSKKSLKDALNDGIGNFSQDTTGATRAIVNRSAETQENTKAKVNLNLNQNVNIKENQNLTNTDDIPSVTAGQKSAVKLEVTKQVKFRDIHKTAAYLVRKDIEEAVDELSRQGGRGFKTRFVNEALRAHLALYGVEIPE